MIPMLKVVRQLTVLVRLGFPLAQGLRNFSDGTSPWLDQLADDLDRGDRLGQAMARQPRLFSPYFRNLLQAAIESPDNQRALADLEGWLSHSERVKRKMATMLLYPSLILTMALVLLSVLGFVIVPGVLQPLAVEVTRHQVPLGAWMGIIPLLLLPPLLLSLAKGQAWPPLLWLFPELLRTRSLASQSLWARALGALLAAGQTPLEAVRQSLDLLESPRLRTQLALAVENQERGHTLARALKNCPDLDPLLLWGLEQPDLAPVLLRTAERLEREVLWRGNSQLQLLLARALVAVGVLVLLGLLAFWWPYYSLTTSLS